MSEGLAQLASISAVLGGFAVAFLSVVLTHRDERRRVGLLLSVATAAAACFFVSALGWSLLAVRGARDGAAAASTLTALHATLQRPLSLTFIAGLLLLFVVLGLGGWLRSRALGIVTTATALVAALGALAVLRRFIE